MTTLHKLNFPSSTSGANQAKTIDTLTQEQKHCTSEEENVSLDKQEQNLTNDGGQHDPFEEEFEDKLDVAVTQSAHPIHTRSKKPTVAPPSLKQTTTIGAKKLPNKTPNLIKLTIKIDRIIHGRLKYQTFKTGKKMAKLIEEFICQNCPEL